VQSCFVAGIFIISADPEQGCLLLGVSAKLIHLIPRGTVWSGGLFTFALASQLVSLLLLASLFLLSFSES
jgi:hypothetical protein